jgi:hypothetical protein
MQHRILQRAVVAVGALMLVACDVHDNGPTVTRNVNATIQMNAAAASSGQTEILNGFTFTGFSGSVLAAAANQPTGLAGQTVSIGFSDIDNADGDFTLTAPNVTASGDVHFASCTFTVRNTSAASVLAVGTVITIQNCFITILATGVELGGTTGTLGTITLTLNGSTSAALPILVFIRDDGVLIVRNGDGELIVTAFTVTGSTGG